MSITAPSLSDMIAKPIPVIQRAEVERQYVNVVNSSICLAEQGDSHLTPFHMAIEGMSSFKGRHLLNNIMRWIPTPYRRSRYLEVGSWKGSTLCAAVFNNDVEAVAIDNFSQFTEVSFGRDRRHPREAIMANLQLSRAFSKPQFDAAVVDQDAFTIDPKQLGTPFDVYFYDGEHVAEAQHKAFVHFAPVLADTFIAIVDDAKDVSTQDATKRAFTEQGWTVVKDWLLYDDCDGTDDGRMKNGWWNGMYIAVVSKTPTPAQEVQS